MVVHIKWNYQYNAYFLDEGAYDHEKEVLLVRIDSYFVESVEEIKKDQLLLYT